MKHKNRVLAFLMTFVMLISQFAGNAMTVHAEPDTGTVSNVKYLDDKGISQNCAKATAVTSGVTAWGVQNETTWYAVTASTECSSSITVTGTVHLILCDGATLTATRGIRVAETTSLFIYAQSKGEDAGCLKITSPDSCNAGIGGGDGGEGGTITINGGNVTATGGMYGAGIGGGYDSTSGGIITINGGTVTANNTSDYTACIGAGYQGTGGDISILGGSVTAHAFQRGIGIGDYGGKSTINIALAKAGDQIDVSDSGSYYDNYSYRGSVTAGSRFSVWRGGEAEGIVNTGNISDTFTIRNSVLKPIIGNILSTDGNVTADTGRLGSTDYYEITEGKSVSLSPKTGYHFVSVTAEDEEGEEIDLADEGTVWSFVMPDKDVNVEAEVEANSYTIKFDKNNDDASGTMEEQEFDYDSWDELRPNMYIIPGKALDRWTTEPDGSGTAYENAEEVKNLTDADGGCITLYAQWRKADEWDELQDLLNNTAENATLKLDRDYTATEGDKSLKIARSLTLDLNGHVIDGAEKVDHVVEPIWGATLTLADSDMAAIHEPGISYHDPVSDEDITITGGVIRGGKISGIYLLTYGRKETMIMNGGTITACGLSGGRGGIYLCGGTDLVINSGLIAGNSCGIVGNGDKNTHLTITAGTIAGNAGNSGGINTSTVDILLTGGRIYHNKANINAGGIELHSSSLRMSGGCIDENIGSCGIALFDDSMFEMSGGRVVNNVGNTGGIFKLYGTVSLSGRVEICGNTTDDGKQRNLYMCSYKGYYTAQISGKLDPASLVGLTYGYGNSSPNYAEALTDGLGDYGNNALEVFFYDDGNQMEDCELLLYDRDWVMRRKGAANIVSFNSAGGSAVPSQKILGDFSYGNYNDKTKALAIEPIVPLKDGYDFTGWYKGDEIYDFSTPVSGNMTLTAGWTVSKRNVTVNNGSGDGKYAKGTTVSITADVPAEGMVFNCWTSEDGVVFDDATSSTTSFVMPGEDVTVTATYKKKDEPYTDPDPIRPDPVEPEPQPQPQPDQPVNPENPETPVQPETPDTPDTPVQPETPKPDTQIPLTPSVNRSVKINDADVSVSINITYPKAVNWTGSKITQAQLAVLAQDGEIAKVKIEGLEKAIAALNKDADLSKLIKVSYVIGKKKKVGEKGSFYVKLSLNSKVCKKAKIKGKDKKALEALIKDINKEFKAHHYEFDIAPVDLSDAKTVESVSIKAAFKNGELQLNEDGSIKKIKSLKIKVKIPGKKKAKTYSFSGKKIAKSFTVKLTDPATKKADVTALDGQNFKGSRSGVEIVK
ncbi:MAG: InlB B-repeat-containing protein [Lachnospiraceae bacterium]|nr:InlB B-repeat-containing protein [Lachnospiraceae bacterium]